MSDSEVLLECFSAAWNARDVAAAMALMADDCWFHTSVGPLPGALYSGRDAVSAAFSAFLTPAPDPFTVAGAVAVLLGDGFAVTRWSTRTERPGEAPVVVHACDVFEFGAGLIRSKDTYRKVAGAAPC